MRTSATVCMYASFSKSDDYHFELYLTMSPNESINYESLSQKWLVRLLLLPPAELNLFLRLTTNIGTFGTYAPCSEPSPKPR